MELNITNNNIIQIPNKDIELFLRELQLVDLEYSAAIKEVETKLKILQEDFQIRYNYNPIEHISSRIKSPESLLNKMVKNKVALNVNEVKERIQDIAGVRVVCSFIPDIYKLVELIKNNTDFIVIKEKDYIKNPKDSGYRSYHLIIKTPIYLTNGITEVKVEIQIRTMAMDFWASLEHKIKYKYNGFIPDDVKKELLECSTYATNLDLKMLSLKNTVDKNNITNNLYELTNYS